MIRINADEIVDAESFHSVFARVFGFPEFYGRNMDAWIDCMSYLDDPTAEMSTVHVMPGETLALILENAERLKSRCPLIFADLSECAAFVNWRCVQAGGRPLLALAYNA
jgi:RNAse (barnase) inhibitor barstar